MASGGPCGACKLLRRKCAAGCVFAPYFGSDEQGPARFAAIHKVFGASNASKLLLHVPLPERCEAVLTIVYEAQARIQDPVYGCVAHILALQHQVASLQAQLIHARAQLARRMAGMQLPETQWQGSVAHPILHSDSCATSVSPQSSLDQIDHSTDGEMIRGVCFKEHSPTQICTRRVAHNELGELQALAQRMMRN